MAKVNKRDVELAFIEEARTMKQVADIFGISREWVRQIVSHSTDPLVKQAYMKRSVVKVNYRGVPCTTCGRVMTVGRGLRGVVVHGSNGNCQACHIYQRRTSHSRRRHVDLPPNCVQCGTLFGHNKSYYRRRAGDICQRCYTRTEPYKASQRKYQAKWRDRAGEYNYRRNARWVSKREREIFELVKSLRQDQ